MVAERVACMRVPAMPLAALLRAEPELVDAALAVSDGAGSRASLLACCDAARRAGVRPGMTAVQAKSLLPDLLLRPLSAALVRSAQAALLDVARAFSPRVRLGADGGVFLDVSGLERHFASEEQLGRMLLRAAEKVGLLVRVGIGAGLLVARLASLTLGDRDALALRVIPPGQEQAFLAPLPVSLLESSARVRAALERFGIERLEQLARLPSAGLGRRLGPEGLRLWRIARGEERDALVADPEPERFVEEVEPGWAIAQLEPLLCAIGDLLQRLSGRLRFRGLSAQRLDLDLRLEEDGRDARTLELAAATREVKSWMQVLRVSLESRPPRGPVSALAVEAQVAPQRQGQLDFFAPAARMDPARLDDVLTRLVALAGEGRVGSPRVRDSHRPDDVALVPLGRPNPVPAGPDPAPRPPLRVVRPPVPVEVRFVRDRPVHLRGGPLGGRVIRVAGPWRLQCGWWQAEMLHRDYFDVELSEGGLIRLFRERDSGACFVDGVSG